MTHHTEAGHMRLATTLVDALLASDLSKREWQVLVFLLRRTYGFNRKSCRATSTFIADGTGLHASHVRAVLRDLEAAGCIEREGQMVLIRKAGFPIARGSKTPKRTETVRTKTVRTKTVRKADRNGAKNGPKQSTSKDIDIDTDTDTPLTPLPGNVTPDLWTDWITHRKQKRSPLTDVAVQRQIAMLAKQPDAAACIEQSLESGWTGLFPVKDTTHGKLNGHKRDPIAEWIARADRDAAAGEAAADHGEVVAQDGGDLWPGALALPRSRQQ